MSPHISRNLWILSACLCMALAGCGKHGSASSNAAPPSTGPVRTGTALIDGIVMLSGTLPQMPLIPNQPCHAGAGPIRDETVVADGAGHLQNAVVFLESAPPAPPVGGLPPAVLDQVDCRYVPHVIALRTGQTLRVTTRDPTLHNVHGLCTVNDPFNFALVAPGQSKDISFAQPEVFPVRCDVHPWMKAYVYVFSHPYFAVTAKDGRFAIRNVPPGSYILAAWQEKYGTLRQHINVENGKTTTVTFTFQSGR